MRWTGWTLGASAALVLAACNGGRTDRGNPPGSESGAVGGSSADTTTGGAGAMRDTTMRSNDSMRMKGDTSGAAGRDTSGAAGRGTTSGRTGSDTSS